jgi:Ca2+-binding RTX toxin-like protein
VPIRVAIALAVALFPAAAEATTCAVSSTTLTVEMTPGTAAAIFKDANGSIYVGALRCAEASAVSAISILGSDGTSESFQIDLEVQGAASPTLWSGAATKAWTIDLGSGLDVVTFNVAQQPHAIAWRFGTLPDGTDVVDIDSNFEADFTIRGVESFAGFTGNGADRIEGRVKLSGQPLARLARPIEVQAGPGNDVIVGGTAADTLRGAAGNDQIDGDAGDDDLWGSNGDDEIHGDAGDDVLIGEDGHDTLDGGAGLDELLGGIGDDFMLGGSGKDLFHEERFVDGNDVMDGGDGIDTVSYGLRRIGMVVDLMAGTGGAAAGGEVDSYAFIENASGSQTGNTLIGDDQPNILTGGPNGDTIIGNGGDDVLYGLSSNDTLNGGAGNDRIRGFNGDDVLDGGTGQDDLGCGAGIDRWSDPDSTAAADCEIQQ